MFAMMLSLLRFADDDPASYGEFSGQLLWHRHVLQCHVIGQTIFEWWIGFANDERRQIAAGRFGDAEAVGTDELARQELFLVGDRRQRGLDDVPAIRCVAKPSDRGHD